MLDGAESSPAHTAVRPQVSVLLIEDDFWTRFTAAEYLRELGYRVVEGRSAHEGMDVLSSGTPVDFVFSDINMAGDVFGGLALARWMAERHPDIPLLLTSGVPPEAPAIQATRLRRFMSKPYDLEEVDRLIQAMV
jgi:DNA-binding NtrC family response regulator